MPEAQADNTLEFPVASDAQIPSNPVKSFSVNRFAQAMVPFAPVSFKTEPGLAWGRVAIYGAIAMATWGKQKKISYVALGALALSTATSLTDFK